MDERLYDSSYKRTGTVSKDAIGNDVIRDASGRVAARFDTDVLGNRVIKDAEGRTKGIFTKDALGNDVVTDPNGRVIARLGADALGNDALLGADGRVIGYSESMNAGIPQGDDRSAYTAVNGPKHYSMSPLEKKLHGLEAKYTAPAVLSFLLPALYCAAAIFVKKLPSGLVLLAALLTAGIFLSSIFGRASDAWSKGTHVATFVISLLIYFGYFIVYTTYRTTWNVPESKEVAYLLVPPVLFLAAELIGGAIGRGINRKLRKSVYGY
ncbi:MAG: hypothetical protein J5586_03575 [Clostridia bacterium]|nr:hypothetical protein [Clostridia bacterium]